MKKIFALILIALLPACATTSQDARIEIYPNVESSNIGNGVALSITVDDARPSGVIGKIDERSQIITSQDLAQLIGVALVDSYSKQGFNVGGANNPNAVQMRVTLEDLSYFRDGSLVSTYVETKSRMKVDVSSKGFIRTYSNSEDRTVPFSSNEATNNSQLRSILERIVEKIVNDGELIAAILR
ncbi:MAG: hypothetical protein HOM63_01575 [Kordiimonadaceae bacterium]|nr:hypothetical protein [Kordiimonadaceae bacterium]